MAHRGRQNADDVLAVALATVADGDGLPLVPAAGAAEEIETLFQEQAKTLGGGLNAAW